MIKKILPVLCLAIVLSAVLFPVAASAMWKPGDPVVPCKIDCGFSDLIQLGKNVMDILIWIAVPLSAILFAYAGGTLIFSGGNEKARDKAKAVFWSAAVGLAIMLVAYIVVYTIASALLDSKYYTNFLGGGGGGGGGQQQLPDNTVF